MKKFYTTFSTAVIHELLDDEVIIANLESGAYYSLRGMAVPIWQMLLAGFSLEDTHQTIAQKYDSAPENILEPVCFFVNSLCAENLLRSKNSDANTKPNAINLPWPPSWHKPEFEKYDEMKNLLMLDPVHEVDEQGWPHQSEK